jgi:hypothetical protein
VEGPREFFFYPCCIREFSPEPPTRHPEPKQASLSVVCKLSPRTRRFCSAAFRVEHASAITDRERRRREIIELSASALGTHSKEDASPGGATLGKAQVFDGDLAALDARLTARAIMKSASTKAMSIFRPCKT